MDFIEQGFYILLLLQLLPNRFEHFSSLLLVLVSVLVLALDIFL
jgi:hypothetical protein